MAPRPGPAFPWVPGERYLIRLKLAGKAHAVVREMRTACCDVTRVRDRDDALRMYRSAIRPSIWVERRSAEMGHVPNLGCSAVANRGANPPTIVATWLPTDMPV